VRQTMSPIESRTIGTLPKCLMRTHKTPALKSAGVWLPPHTSAEPPTTASVVPLQPRTAPGLAKSNRSLTTPDLTSEPAQHQLR